MLAALSVAGDDTNSNDTLGGGDGSGEDHVYLGVV